MSLPVLALDTSAAKWILIGYFFKHYVANNLNEMTSYMSFPLHETLQTQDRWLLVFLYSYQIYAVQRVLTEDFMMLFGVGRGFDGWAKHLELTRILTTVYPCRIPTAVAFSP